MSVGKNSHRLRLGKTKSSVFSAVFDRILFILAGIEDIHKSLYEFEFRTDPPLTTELAALEHLKNRCNHVISVDIDLIFFKLAGNKDMHDIKMSLNCCQFGPPTTELAALERLRNTPIDL